MTSEEKKRVDTYLLGIMVDRGELVEGIKSMLMHRALVEWLDNHEEDLTALETRERPTTAENNENQEATVEVERAYANACEIETRILNILSHYNGVTADKLFGIGVGRKGEIQTIVADLVDHGKIFVDNGLLFLPYSAEAIRRIEAKKRQRDVEFVEKESESKRGAPIIAYYPKFQKILDRLTRFPQLPYKESTHTRNMKILEECVSKWSSKNRKAKLAVYKRLYAVVYRLYHDSYVSVAELSWATGLSEGKIRNIIGVVFTRMCTSDDSCVFKKALEEQNVSVYGDKTHEA